MPLNGNRSRFLGLWRQGKRMKKKETRKKSEALVKSNENGVEQSYIAWIADLKRRYRATQIKAAIAVNFSTQNLRYCLHFYELYSVQPNFQQLVGKLVNVPWGHHCTIIDKCKGDPEKALFYVLRTLRNGWSRNSLLNWLSTDLYECEEYWRIPA